MDPVSLAIGAVGLGMQLFGGIGQSSEAKQAAAVSQDIARQEQGVNDVKQHQMDMEAQRMQMENIRNTQRARAMGLNAAVNQGAQYGSGLQGGLAQVTDQGLFNMQGVNFAKSYADQISGYNNAISGDKEQLASIQGQSSTDAGIASLGGALMKAGPTIGAFGKGVSTGFSNIGSSLFGGGSPSGYGA